MDGRRNTKCVNTLLVEGTFTPRVNVLLAVRRSDNTDALVALACCCFLSLADTQRPTTTTTTHPTVSVSLCKLSCCKHAEGHGPNSGDVT